MSEPSIRTLGDSVFPLILNTATVLVEFGFSETTVRIRMFQPKFPNYVTLAHFS
ncbi:MAG: hypothetical protein VYA69_01325 [Gemmatimonadota bacterium]|uniref:Uncharacterized protein n=1 Tax=marine metagenome TaxID=408172 RepID=A0A382K3K6_9ZZZZ|nr:hypothetical protein [Gemmatimonadota bacterium]